jgi:hypothetical protein
MKCSACSAGGMSKTLLMHGRSPRPNLTYWQQLKLVTLGLNLQTYGKWLKELLVQR